MNWLCRLSQQRSVADIIMGVIGNRDDINVAAQEMQKIGTAACDELLAAEQFYPAAIASIRKLKLAAGCMTMTDQPDPGLNDPTSISPSNDMPDQPIDMPMI